MPLADCLSEIESPEQQPDASDQRSPISYKNRYRINEEAWTLTILI